MTWPVSICITLLGVSVLLLNACLLMLHRRVKALELTKPVARPTDARQAVEDRAAANRIKAEQAALIRELDRVAAAAMRRAR